MKTPWPDDDSLRLLCDVLKDVARRVPADHAADFVQFAHLKLAERQYDVFRRFTGRSSLRTYLTVVATRLLLDWRNAEYGRWRPSAQARRLGPAAIHFERLTHRDGHTPAEARQLLEQRHRDSSHMPVASLVETLPARAPWRRTIPIGAQDFTSSPGGWEPLAERTKEEEHARVSAALSRALDALAPDDRAIVDARYFERRSLRDIALATGELPRRVYRRHERILKELRMSMRATPNLAES